MNICKDREREKWRKTATADARIARVLCKQNELNASIQHSFASLLKRKESQKWERHALRQLKKKRWRERDREKKRTNLCISITRPVLRIYVA